MSNHAFILMTVHTLISSFISESSLKIQIRAFNLCFFFNASISSLKYPSCTDFMIFLSADWISSRDTKPVCLSSILIPFFFWTLWSKVVLYHNAMPMILFILDQLGTFSDRWATMPLFWWQYILWYLFLSLNHLLITLHLQFVFPSSCVPVTKIYAFETSYCLNFPLLYSGLFMDLQQDFL